MTEATTDAQLRLIAGFDAGQTHTTCRLAWLHPDGRFSPIAEGQGSGVSHLAAAQAERRFSEALQSSATAAQAAAQLSPDLRLAAAVVGASGIEAGSRVQDLGHQLASRCLGLPATQVVVCGDERTALQGAFGNNPGILVISGTGCISLGRNQSGDTHRCGGWGWLLDGAGSAMDIGHDALALSVQMADGRLPDTPLRDQLWRALQVNSAEQLKATVVAADFGAAGFARLAPLVDHWAAAGDEQAGAVIRRSAEALAQMVAGVARALQLNPAPVCGVGGALRHLQQLRQQFQQELKRHCPTAQLLEPQGDACDGALQLAAQAALRC